MRALWFRAPAARPTAAASCSAACTAGGTLLRPSLYNKVGVCTILGGQAALDMHVDC